MIRLIHLSDFTEAFPHNILQGVLRYAKEHAKEPWVVCKIPISFKNKHGIGEVLEWAKQWEANAIIGCFESPDEIKVFQRNGISVVAQDFRQRFPNTPNIITDNFLTGQMAAEQFLMNGYREFAFFGYSRTIWSDERCEGFRKAIASAGYGNHFHTYTDQQLDRPWFYDSLKLTQWLKDLPPKTAMLACDDNQGNIITEACKLCDMKIPDDIAVMGVDNDLMKCELSAPTISSIELNIEQAGYETADLITQLLAEPETQIHDIVIKPTTIIHRTSTNYYATDDPNIAKALDYIHSHLKEPISVNDIIREVPLSRRLLEIRFKKVTGKSVYQYILHFRIKLLAQRVSESNKPIMQIANEMGFNNFANLSKQFKTVMGCTITKYRKTYTKSR